MNTDSAFAFVEKSWDESIVPTLHRYIEIPNKSPAFDTEWAEHGHMDRAVELLERWCREQPVEGMTTEIVRLPGRTPLLLVEVPGQGDDTVLLYGHYDKQPEFSGWEDGLGPWKPVQRDGRLYGRGGADDGYAVFASLTALRTLRQQGIPHARAVLLIEGCEESGSFDLPHYVEALAERIGEPSLIVCLDAECGNYDQLWVTTSLRGNLVGTLSVEVLTEGVHSGMASGIVPSSFRVLRALLDRVEDSRTGAVVDALAVEIPEARRAQAKATADVLGEAIRDKFPWVDGMRPAAEDPLEQVLASTWRPTLSVTGADGMPSIANAGNTLRPGTAIKLSFRLPPTADANAAAKSVKEILEADPPYGAKVLFDVDSSAPGWNAPPVADWLDRSLQTGSRTWFGKDAMYMGTGGTIPFMPLLGEAFPDVQFVVSGVLGPHSNAHGPNEFLHIATGKKVTACVAQVLADHYRQGNGG